MPNCVMVSTWTFRNSWRKKKEKAITKEKGGVKVRMKMREKEDRYVSITLEKKKLIEINRYYDTKKEILR